MKQNSRIIEEMYESMQGLHHAGLVTEAEMVEFDAMYDSYKAPQYSADMVKALRQRFNLTQMSLASVLNTSISSVRQWEQGNKKPSGTASKLLNLLDRKGLVALR